jgi:hypothetical protein
MKTPRIANRILIILICLYLANSGCLKMVMGQSGSFTDPRDEQKELAIH